MINAISTVTQIQPAAQPVPVNQKPPAARPQATPADVVTLSGAAHSSAQVTKQPPAAGPQATPANTATLSSAVQAAAQEATETPAQTAIEASKGDTQAQRLLAKEAAAKAAYESYQK